MVGGRAASGQSAMAQPSGLLNRVHAILKSNQRRTQPGAFASLFVGTTGLALAVLVGSSALLPADNDATPNKTENREEAQVVGSGIEDKLHTIIFPQVQFEDATLDDVLDYLRQESRTLDPAGRGINIISKLQPSRSIPNRRTSC